MQSVDAVSIGTELDILDWQFRTDWASTIQAVRGVYRGAVTYDSMFSQYSGAKDVGDVVFWDLVDFISCSFYVRLSKDDTLSAPSLAALMRNTPGVDIADPIAYLQQIANKHGKQIFTLEGGYQSANGALWGVNDYYGAAATENQGLQSRGLEAYLFTLNFNQGNWLKGVSLWDLQPRHWRSHTWDDRNYRNGWGMYHKAAADTVKKGIQSPRLGITSKRASTHRSMVHGVRPQILAASVAWMWRSEIQGCVHPGISVDGQHPSSWLIAPYEKSGEWGWYY